MNAMQPMTQDELTSMSIPYNGKTLLLMPVKNPDADTGFEIQIPLNNGNTIKMRLITKELKRKDWFYRVAEYSDNTMVGGGSHLFVDYQHLLEGITRILDFHLKSGIRVVPNDTVMIC